MLKDTIVANPHLVVLKLPYNNLGDNGASIIASAIFDDNSKVHHALSVLDLSFNSIGDTGCGALALRCIAGNSLCVSFCGFCSMRCIAVGHVRRPRSYVQVLDARSVEEAVYSSPSLLRV